MKQRNANIELWRCFCMFAVVVQHVLFNNELCGMDAFKWHIPGFLIISGFFGVRFSFSKLLKLVSIAYASFWLTIPLRGGGDVLTLLLPHGGWFLPFYCVLLIVSPILNAALENDKNRKMILFSAMLLMIAGWVPTFTTDPHIGMMRVPGMQGNGLMMMVALYIFGFFVNQYRVAQKAAYVVWAVAFLIGITACYCMGRLCPTACHYASPVSAVTAIAGFCLFMTLPRIRGRSAKIVNFIAPSMFSVYLIHECCIKQYQYLPHQSDVSDAFVRAVVLFVVSIAIDLMRRAIFAGLYRVNVRIRQKLW